MKRFANLLPRIATWENVALAFHKAAAGKRRSPAVARFAGNLDREIHALVRELAEGAWQPGKFHRFLVRDPKLRVIHAAPFRDRVAHHAIMNVAGPCFEHGAVDHSYACRQGRGNLAAVEHAARCTKSRRFFLKLDIRRYFDSIHHETLRTLFRRQFKDGAFLHLLDRVLDSFHATEGRGLPIGTLTSQYFANFYLDGLDHWIAGTLPRSSFPNCVWERNFGRTSVSAMGRWRSANALTEQRSCGDKRVPKRSLGTRASAGAPQYVRYMDDFILWHDDEAVLQRWLGEISAWLGAERGLELKGAPRLAPCREGVPFLGYRITPVRVLLARTARRRFSARLRGYECAHAEGRMTSRDLQRRADALLAFVQVAECRAWRQRLLATLPSESDSCA